MTRIIDVSGDPNLLYEGEIDGRVMCTVERTGAGTAKLVLWNGGEKIYSRVGITAEHWGAAVWEQIALKQYDAWLASQ